jgi:hypothetical protein
MIVVEHALRESERSFLILERLFHGMPSIQSR